MKLETILPSVVAVRTSIPDDAYTANTLGTKREGSGVVIRDNGLVLTIGYLITEAEEVWLTRHDGRVVAGHPLAYDQASGFGLVQALGPLDLPALVLGQSDKTKLGDPVVLADGMGETVKANIIAKQEFAGYWEYLLEEALFIAPAHKSWGGAALVDAEGRLIGIGSLRLQIAQKDDVADINMVVPIDLLKPILDDLLRHGQVNRPPRPWLGAFTVESDGDVIVSGLANGGPAAQAGMRPGDIIAEIRNSEVDGLADLYRKVWSSGPVGTELPMRIVRDGRETWLRLKSGDRGAYLKKPQMQ